MASNGIICCAQADIQGERYWALARHAVKDNITASATGVQTRVGFSAALPVYAAIVELKLV